VKRSGWPLLILLAVSVVINYMDRGNLGVAAPRLAGELGLTDSRLGLLLSAFFWTYAACQIIGGWLVDRWDVTRVYAAGFLLWSAATLAIGLVNSFAMLLALRLILGMGESVAFPAYSKLLASGFREEQRGLANSIIDSATKFGPAIGVLFGGWFIGLYGWRSFFIITGGLSLLWLLPWWRYAPRQQAAEVAGEAGPGWADILKSRAAWATFLGLFCNNYNWFLLLTWLPSFLVRERHYTMSQMAVINALPLCVTAVSTLIAGWYSDRLIARGAAVVRLRRNFMATGLGISALTLPLATLTDPRLALAALGLAFFGIGIYCSNSWALTQTLAGPGAAGRWTGLQNSFANLGGVVAPLVTGYLVERTGTFLAAFLTSSAVLAFGVFVYLVVLPMPETAVSGPVRPSRRDTASA